MSKLTNTQVEVIKQRVRDGDSVRTLAKDFGVSTATIVRHSKELKIEEDWSYGMNRYLELDLAKTYRDDEYDSLTPRNVWFVRKHLREGDWTLEEIADDVGCSYESVWLIHQNKIYRNVGHSKSEFLAS